MEMAPRDAKIKNRFTASIPGLIPQARASVESQRTWVRKVLDQGDVPNVSFMAEASAKLWYLRMVEIKVTEGKSWSDALDAVRDMAQERVVNFVESPNPWDRADEWTQKRAAAWFLRETDGM